MKENPLLYDLFQAYYDARKHKRNTRSQLEFEFNLEENLIQLYQELRDRTYKVGRSVCFISGKAVKREVFAAHFRDRVVHHLLFNYTAPIFESTFISDSYSCRKGMGTLYGVERFEHHLRSCSDNWRKPCYVLKMDIRGYFMHINRQKLYEMVMETLKHYAYRKARDGKCWMELLDYDLLKYLMQEIIYNDPTLGCEMRGTSKDWDGLPPDKSLFHVAKGCGLPIGNLTSQLFSNVYLNVLDQYVKRVLGEKYYGRYVDDFFIIGNDRHYLLSLIPELRRFLETELDLTLHPNKVFLQHAHKGCAFLGIFVKPYRRYLLRKTKHRISGRIAYIHVRVSGQNISIKREDLQHISYVVNSYMGYMRHMACFRFKHLLVERNANLAKIGEFVGEQKKFVVNLPGLAPAIFRFIPLFLLLSLNLSA
ncbi:RNA-directed DNA polymerase [Bacteroides sp.]|uniref:RNA-directed DNA polymerase n=1 Tax=Bacteroides sp. TaxID=29523 RepID=UPI002625CF96|nr:RNA-directed DNA polymerase [Bacteroides sp.]